MFRKGKALGEQGFFDKAVKILEEVKEKNPSGLANHVLWLTYHHLDIICPQMRAL
jgi:hypothetical protein